jgi:ribonuclease I
MLKKCFILLLISTFTFCFLDEAPVSKLKFLEEKDVNSHIQTFYDTPDYDMYVFTVQWANTICLGSSYCKTKSRDWSPRNSFTIHGLWPSLISGKILPDCMRGKYKIDTDSFDDTLIKMNKYWVSLKNSNEEGFWGHEYSKHGYCYTQKYRKHDKDYFDLALKLFIDMKLDVLGHKIFINKDRNQYTYSELISSFKKFLPEFYFELSCIIFDNKQYLSEVRFFFDMNVEPLEGIRYLTRCKKEGEGIFITLE